MNFALSEEQRLLAGSLGRFLDESVPPVRVREVAATDEGHDPALWNALAELGVAGMMTPEEHGGSAASTLDAVVVAETLGYHCAPVPFLSTCMASAALARGGTEAQKENWLPRIARGESCLGVAVGDQVSEREGARVRAKHGRLGGKALFALDATAAEGFLVATDDARLALVSRDASGLAIEPLPTIDRTRRFAELQFEDVEVDDWLDVGAGLIDAVIDLGRLLLAADILGASQRALDLAVAYAGERKQFDRVIGSFQAVKHLCAEMAAELEPARSLLWYAGHAFDAVPSEAPLVTAHAKAHLSEIGRFVVRTATEVHGGIGFTEECDVQLFFKRVGVARSLLGSPEQVRARAGALQGWSEV